MKLKAANGSAPIGFALAAPIGLVLLFASFDLTFLVWNRSVVQLEMQRVVAQIARQPQNSDAVLQEWRSQASIKPMSSSLQSRTFAGEKIYVLSAKFETRTISGLPTRFLIRVERTSELS